MAEKKNSYVTEFGSDATENPQRIVFITKNTSAKVKGEPGRRLMSYPHLLLREMITFQVLTIVLVLVSLFWDAPLEQLANPQVTPNPAKAPWYFLGLQELLHYFPPLVAGILIPTLVIIGLAVIPYFNVNIQGKPLWAGNRRKRLTAFLIVVAVLLGFFGAFKAWTPLVPTVVIAGLAVASYLAPIKEGKANKFQTRPLSWWIMTWFITVALTLTTVGTLFRGPRWTWVWFWPWR